MRSVEKLQKNFGNVTRKHLWWNTLLDFQVSALLKKGSTKIDFLEISGIFLDIFEKLFSRTTQGEISALIKLKSFWISIFIEVNSKMCFWIDVCCWYLRYIRNIRNDNQYLETALGKKKYLNHIDYNQYGYDIQLTVRTLT